MLSVVSYFTVVGVDQQATCISYDFQPNCSVLYCGEYVQPPPPPPPPPPPAHLVAHRRISLQVAHFCS